MKFIVEINSLGEPIDEIDIALAIRQYPFINKNYDPRSLKVNGL